MTRDEAIKMYRVFGMNRIEVDFRERFPQALCDRMLSECAEDAVDGLIAVGVLKVDQPSPHATVEGGER